MLTGRQVFYHQIHEFHLWSLLHHHRLNFNACPSQCYLLSSCKLQEVYFVYFCSNFSNFCQKQPKVLRTINCCMHRLYISSFLILLQARQNLPKFYKLMINCVLKYISIDYGVMYKAFNSGFSFRNIKSSKGYLLDFYFWNQMSSVFSAYLLGQLPELPPGFPPITPQMRAAILSLGPPPVMRMPSHSLLPPSQRFPFVQQPSHLMFVFSYSCKIQY